MVVSYVSNDGITKLEVDTAENEPLKLKTWLLHDSKFPIVEKETTPDQ